MSDIAEKMDHRSICELEAHGDIETLARALRNIIKVTDVATSFAQAEARQTGEHVWTEIGKGAIYDAMDKALRGEEMCRLQPGPISEEAPF